MSPEDKDLLDEAAGLRFAGGQPALYRRLLLRFVETQGDLLVRLEGALADGNVHEAARLLHTLKSAAATIGSQRVSALACELEARVAELDRADAPMSPLRETFPMLLQRVAERLEAPPAD